MFVNDGRRKGHIGKYNSINDSLLFSHPFLTPPVSSPFHSWIGVS